MKKNDWFILIATAAYSYLFYHQSPGLNFFLFSVLLVSFCFMRDTKLAREWEWLLMATGTLISGFAVFYYGNSMAIPVTMLSFLLLAAISFKPKTSLFVSFFNSLFSFAVSVVMLPREFVSRSTESGTPFSMRIKKLILLVLPALVTLLFFLLYRGSNPVFEKVTDNISLDFIAAGWIIFTGFGLILMYGFFNQRALGFITRYENRNPNQLGYISEEEHQRSVISTFISLPSELFTATALLVLLNLLLVTVNGIDVYYLYILQRLPDNLSYSEYVHDGTNALIFSILLAVSIILFFFRGRLNFIEDNRWVKIFTYTWIAQNILLIATTARRNYFYIADMGLTESRIGVYIFLGLCIAGLVTTFIKVWKTRSNWFMFRKNTWIWYCTLVSCCTINWNAMIATNNLNLAIKKQKPVDAYYLSTLDYPALPTLYKFFMAEQAGNRIIKNFTPALRVQMMKQCQRLEASTKNADWQSFCLLKAQIVKDIDTSKLDTR